MNSSLNKPCSTNRCENVVSLMQKVQACSWSPFRLAEIVSLERCLQEVASEDLRIAQWIKRMAHEVVFVEPSRRKVHLERSEGQCRLDAELMVQAGVMKEKARRMQEEIEHYRRMQKMLDQREPEISREIEQIQQKIPVKETSCEVLIRDFKLLMERVQDSFSKTINIIKESLPDYMDMVNECGLLQQLDQLPKLHRSFIIHLIRNYETKLITPKNKMETSYFAKKTMLKAMQVHLEAVRHLKEDLELIDKALKEDIPEEVEFLNNFHDCIEYLEVAQTEPPKHVILVLHDLDPAADVPVSGGLPDEDEDAELESAFDEMSRELNKMTLKDQVHKVEV